MKEYKKGDKVLYNGKTMTVTEVKPKGWTDDMVVSDGEQSWEINEYDCVHAPNEVLEDEASRLEDYLMRNDVYGNVRTEASRTYLHIEYGDWKHDHGFADHLMSLLGYVRIGTQVTEDDGSDCYSAIHTYLKPTA